MKEAVSLVFIVLSLALLLPPAAGACNRTVPPTVITYWPPGPDGVIYVESSPVGAVIYLNGENRGHAPVSLTGLWPGTYTITAEMAGYQEFTTTTTISGPTRSSVYCPLLPINSGNMLSISSTPSGAKIYIDDIYRGETPAVLAKPSNSSLTIRLELDGYEDWKTTIVSAGGSGVIAPTLVPGVSGTGRGITVSSIPAGATVTLDGLARGTTPVTLGNLVAGIHILELDSDGYQHWKSTVDVPETGISNIPVTLTRKPESTGGIVIFSDPGNTSVSLDGALIGLTDANGSLDIGAVPAGEHTLSLGHPGYEPYTTQTKVVSGIVSEVGAELLPLTGIISVSSVPSGATITIDNGSAGFTPNIMRDISPGNHTILLTMNGYQDNASVIMVTAGQTSTISVSLLPATTDLHSPVLPVAPVIALLVTVIFQVRRKR